MKALLWAQFLPRVLASPLELMHELTEDGVSVNNSDHHAWHIYKRDFILRYPGVEFGNKCSDEQMLHIAVEIDEIRQVLDKAIPKLELLTRAIEKQIQPRNWGAREDEAVRIIDSWQTFIARIKFTPLTKTIGDSAPPTTWAETGRMVKKLAGMYERIRDALPDASLDILIHCSDDFLTYRADKSTAAKRVYEDTRPIMDRSDEDITIAATGRVCHESTNINAWRFTNKVSSKEEICICPHTFERSIIRQSPLRYGELAHFANDPSQLLGKSLDEPFYKAVAGPLFHELTHCENILGDERTGDMQFSARGLSGPAYGVERIGTLAGYNPDLSLKNADSVTYLALALYYSMCVWSDVGCKQEPTWGVSYKADDGRKGYYNFVYQESS